MIPDHDCVPGLDRAVSLSDYAKLENLREADVLATIGQLKIPAAYFRGQWFIEAPPNCEARLAQLRSDKAGTRSEGGLADWVRGLADTHTQSDLQPQGESRPSELPPRDPISQPKAVRDPVPQPAGDRQDAERPQPIDYGLDETLNLHWNSGANYYWQARHAAWPRWCYNIAGLAVWAVLIGGLSVTNKDTRFDGFIIIGVALACLLFGMLPGFVFNRLRERARPAREAYGQALHEYIKQETAAREAAHEADLLKRSYWAFLDGYEFERATAEVLSKHQFNTMVTPGSGDGGIDIEVTRNDLKGVVQCKAHTSCVGPHVVRDLYGVIHHCRADFGIIVSRGGFTRGADDFRRDKPILFLDTDDLIAMQEGRDVLASAFSRKDS